MPECWVCKQKAEWKLEQLEKIRSSAKELAVKENMTVGIIKEGCKYQLILSKNITNEIVVEYVSKW